MKDKRQRQGNAARRSTVIHAEESSCVSVLHFGAAAHRNDSEGSCRQEAVAGTAVCVGPWITFQVTWSIRPESAALSHNRVRLLFEFAGDTKPTAEEVIELRVWEYRRELPSKH